VRARRQHCRGALAPARDRPPGGARLPVSARGLLERVLLGRRPRRALRQAHAHHRRRQGPVPAPVASRDGRFEQRDRRRRGHRALRARTGVRRRAGHGRRAERGDARRPAKPGRAAAGRERRDGAGDVGGRRRVARRRGVLVVRARARAARRSVSREARRERAPARAAVPRRVLGGRGARSAVATLPRCPACARADVPRCARGAARARHRADGEGRGDPERPPLRVDRGRRRALPRRAAADGHRRGAARARGAAGGVAARAQGRAQIAAAHGRGGDPRVAPAAL
ncbi:MAG: hypothetical protein AVDCRST_MAG67-1915, partial [uncultured Solirubrobacteraceae bacterium]